MSKPDFIGIGAARSGTTWLCSQLQQHPDVWLPRRKELHYFTRDISYLSPGYLRDATWKNRIFSKHIDFRMYRRNLIRAMGRNILNPNRNQLFWDMKYYFGVPDDQWYLSLFEGASDKVTGEITPAYALLGDDDVKSLVDFLPEVKVFYIMRDPIERAWSTIRYHEKRYGTRFTDMGTDKIKAYLSNNAIAERSNFPDVIDRWKRFLPEGQFQIFWYDQIAEEPDAIRKKILNFVGIDEESSVDTMENKQVNASIDKTLPVEVRKFLMESYSDTLRELDRRYPDSYPSKWLSYQSELCDIPSN